MMCLLPIRYTHPTMINLVCTYYSTFTCNNGHNRNKTFKGSGVLNKYFWEINICGKISSKKLIMAPGEINKAPMLVDKGTPLLDRGTSPLLNLNEKKARIFLFV